MTHQKNLKIIAFVGEGADHAVDYLTEKHFPKVAGQDIVEQIEHLVGAGQHRIVTCDIATAKKYQDLVQEFPGESYLVTVGATPDETAQLADHHISDDPKIIDELLEKLDFTP